MPTLLPRFAIHQPASVAEASEMLTHYAEDACAYAGGTELLLAMKQGGLRYEHLVDLKTVPDLSGVRRENGSLRIGALTTHLALERSPVVAEHLPVFVSMERQVANVRVRATGTLGGNLCFGEPHSDPATLLLCLGATTRIVGKDGARELPLDEFIVGPYEVALEPGEILEAVDVPLPGPSQRVSYQKFKTHEYPMLGLALMIDVDEDNQTIGSARLALGAVSPTPRRGPEAEELLVGSIDDVAKRLDDAAEVLADGADLLDDNEGSAEYKRNLVHVFLKRAFAETTARAAR